ncbi:hypothetical protein LCGC14_0716720 [marine sediment metagenome]|uniref:Uncharacterized protein n=1 Tax=marine sediment metagenome TaxID=412755 RepID=A0A0F9QDH3_9ZZZZ
MLKPKDRTLSFGMKKRNFWQTYFPKDDNTAFNRKKPELRSLFKEMLLDQDYMKNIKDFYEILSSHDNDKVKYLAQDILQNEISKFPPEKLSYFFRLWLNYPIQRITDILTLVEERLKNSPEKDDMVKYLVRKIFDKNSQFSFSEVQLSQIEEYIKPFPLLYKPIQRRINNFRKNQVSNKLRHEQQAINAIGGDNYNLTLNRAIFNKMILTLNNPKIIWERLINSSLIIIIEYFSQISLFKKWTPFNDIEHDLFDMIKETFQTKGWHEHTTILLEAIKCDLKSFQRYNFKLELNPYILHFPEYFDFTQLNTYSLTAKCVQNTLLRKIINIYLNEDFKLFQLELDTLDSIDPQIQDGKCIINNSVVLNLNFLISLLKPLILLGHNETSELLNSGNREEINKISNQYNAILRKNQKYFYFFKKITEFTIQKRCFFKFKRELKSLDENYKIYDLKEPTLKPKQSKKREITLTIDFGNYKTTVCAFDKKTGKVINGKELIKQESSEYFIFNKFGIKIDSVIFIHPEEDVLYGSEHQDSIINESHVIWGMKKKIRNNVYDNYNILGRGLNLLEITKDLFNFIFKAIDWDKFNLLEVGFSYPVDSSPEYRVWLKEVLVETFGINESKINFIDEATANCLGLVYLENFEIILDKYYLIIDIGGGTTDCAILQFKTIDGKSVDIFSRKSESIGGSSIEKQLFFEIKRKSEIEIESSQKDKLIYFMGKKKIELYSRKLENEKRTLNQIEFEINKEDIDNIIEKRKLSKKIINIIYECIDESFQSGADKIDFVILTGGGSETPLFKEEVINFCKSKINASQIIHLKEEFSIALGLQTLFLDFNIQAKILDSFGSLELNSIYSQYIDFNILIERFTRFPTAFLQFKLFPHKYNQTGLNLLHFYTIREITEDTDDEWDLAVVKEKLGATQLFIAERLTEQFITVPLYSLIKPIDIFLQINGEKKILLFYPMKENPNSLIKMEIGKIR